MPWHLAIDQASERRPGKPRIGMTSIGPCYADKAMRPGIRVQDVRGGRSSARRSRRRSPRRTSGSSACTRRSPRPRRSHSTRASSG
jgi:adenylosuccinate synthase